MYRELSNVFKLLPKNVSTEAIYALHRLGLLRRYIFSSKHDQTYIEFTKHFKGGLSASAYAHRLSDAKIVLCPRGFVSSETFRHVEALRAGAVIISEALPDTNIYRHSPIITIRNWKDGLLKAKQLLLDEDRLIHLQKESIRYYEETLSERATARYISKQIISG